MESHICPLCTQQPIKNTTTKSPAFADFLKKEEEKIRKKKKKIWTIEVFITIHTIICDRPPRNESLVTKL